MTTFISRISYPIIQSIPWLRLCDNAITLHFFPLLYIHNTCTIQWRFEFLFWCVLGTPVPRQPKLRLQVNSDTYSEHSGTSNMKLFSKIVNGFQALTMLIKSFILDVWLGSGYASAKLFVSYCLLKPNYWTVFMSNIF